MLKFTKVLIIIAVVFAVAALGLSCYMYYLIKTQPPVATNQSTTPAVDVRPELYEKYFTNLELTKKEYSPAEATQVTWQLKKNLPEATLFVLKVLNTNRDIFISETAPLALQKYQGSSFGNPGKPGSYELWVYLAETDNNQTLVAALPFSISK